MYALLLLWILSYVCAQETHTYTHIVFTAASAYPSPYLSTMVQSSLNSQAVIDNISSSFQLHRSLLFFFHVVSPFSHVFYIFELCQFSFYHLLFIYIFVLTRLNSLITWFFILSSLDFLHLYPKKTNFLTYFNTIKSNTLKIGFVLLFLNLYFWPTV